jgi:hypothetical protein
LTYFSLSLSAAQGWIAKHIITQTTPWFWFKNAMLLALWYLAIQIEFGVVYFIMLCFYVVYSNLGERREGDMSAYSVFNKNMAALPGNFSAGDFDRSLRSGGGVYQQHQYNDDQD